MLHERVDEWVSRTAPSPSKEGSETEIGFLSLPADIATLERLRASAYAGLPDLTRVPTDVFVWRAGEPDQRAVTKIAGLPHRPAGLPWPQDASGEPLAFIAQVCFADSRDVVPPLPGDILLIFGPGRPSPSSDVPFELDWGAGLTFEWSALGDFPLVDVADIPSTPWPVFPCYGALQRMWDYRGVPPEIAVDIPAVVEATKIGGLCPWLDEPDVVRWGPEAGASGAPGTYLCTLATVDPDVYASLPGLQPSAPATPATLDPDAVRAWRQAQLRDYRLWRSRALMIPDAGLLNVFLDASGRSRWTGHCQT